MSARVGVVPGKLFQAKGNKF